MPAERYFFPGPIKEQETVLIEGAELHHLVNVMRAKLGEEVELVNGSGLLAKGKLVKIGKHHAEICIFSLLQKESQKPRLLLFQSFCLQNRLDLVIEKGTELGVDHFYFFPGELSAKKEWYPSQTERALSLMKASMKQCGRLFIPKMTILPKIEGWKELPKTTFFGKIKEKSVSLWKALHKLPPQETEIAFLTGPESGLTSKEEEMLEALGAEGVFLHENILRTETASLNAISLMGAHLQYSI